MPASTEIFDMVVDLSANTDRFVKDVQAAASHIELDFDTKPMIRRFVKSQSALQDALSKTVGNAVTAGFKVDRIKGFEARIRSITEKISDQQRLLLKAELEARQKGMTEERRETLFNEKIKLHGLQKRLAEEEKSVGDIIKRQKDAHEEWSRLMKRTSEDVVKSLGKASQEMGEGIQSAFNKARGGDVSGLLGSLGKGSSSAGASLQKRAAAAQVAGQGGKMMGMLGNLGGMLAKLGPYIAALAGVAAGLTAVLGVVAAADSAMKDLNKTLLAGGVAGNDLADSYGRLGTTIDDIRGQFTNAFMFNRIWGTTAKDHLEILGAYATAGLTMKEMAAGARDAGEEMERLKDYTVAALTYSKLLGMSTQEISGTMANYMEELGMTLEGVQGRFAAISAVAKESGFSTKRFFNMVLQATSGMSMYNVRLEEAAGLLINLGKILGEQVGGDFLQSLMKGFKDEGTQQRVQKTLTTGLGYSLGVLQKDAARSADEFSRKLGELSDTNKEAINTALSGVGAAGLSGKDLAKKLAGLSGTQQTKLLSEVRGTDAGMARMLSSLMRSSDVFKGGLGGAQAARSDAGAGASLLLRLSEMRGVTGKRIDQINRTDITEMMAANQITGAQGEEFLKLYETGRAFAGDLARLQDMRKEILAGGDMSAINAQAQALGVTFDDAGNMFKAIMGPGGEFEGAGKQLGMNFEDYVMAMGDRAMLDTETKVAEDIALAQEIAANTTDMAKILEQGVEVLLSKIYGSVQYIASFLGAKSMTESQKGIRGAALQQATDTMQGTRSSMISASSEAQRLRSAAGRASSPEKKQQLLARAETKESEAKKLGRDLRVQEKLSRAVGRMQGGGFSNVNEMMDKAASDPEMRKWLISQMTPEEKKAFDMSQKRRDASLARRGASMDKFGGGTTASSMPVSASPLAALGVSFDPEAAERKEEERAKEQIDSNETALEKQTKEYRKIAEEMWSKEKADKVAGLLQQYMPGAAPDSLQTMSHRLLAGETPRALEGALANTDLRTALNQQGVLVGPQADDFVMHIGASGKVKYAQRVHPGDETVAMSARPGGGISRGGGGGGNVTIVQHNYADMESIKKGWRALRAAKAL